MPEKPQTAKPEYKNILHFAAAFVTVSLVFATSLATLITILFFGLNIIRNGVPMCVVLAQNNALHTLLYNVCGCAVVELTLLPLAAIGTWLSAPRLFRQFQYVRHASENLARKQEKKDGPQDPARR